MVYRIQTVKPLEKGKELGWPKMNKAHQGCELKKSTQLSLIMITLLDNKDIQGVKAFHKQKNILKFLFN